MGSRIAHAKKLERRKRPLQNAFQRDEPEHSAVPWQLHVFKTKLGWMAALGRQGTLVQLTIAGESPGAAVARLDTDDLVDVEESCWCPSLARRLKAFAAGSPADFDDVPVENQDLTAFQLRVLKCCRKIPWGQTISYGELARQAGRPGAARAVGNVMASVRCPVVIPCHRVVSASGQVSRFSASEASRLKLRLLEIEG